MNGTTLIVTTLALGIVAGCAGRVTSSTRQGHDSGAEASGGGSAAGAPGSDVACIPMTCAGAGVACGALADGCGHTLDCGACPVGPDGGHDANADTALDAIADATLDAIADADADSEACVPLTCQQQGFDCGSVNDGCGHWIDCGTCAGCTVCGTGGPHVCGPPPACVCVTCSQLGDNCGQASNGCGGLLDCGTCTSPQTCGGGGIPNQCGVPP